MKAAEQSRDAKWCLICVCKPKWPREQAGCNKLPQTGTGPWGQASWSGNIHTPYMLSGARAKVPITEQLESKEGRRWGRERKEGRMDGLLLWDNIKDITILAWVPTVLVSVTCGAFTVWGSGSWKGHWKSHLCRRQATPACRPGAGLPPASSCYQIVGL